jgi:hypothetical protein
VRKVGGAVQRVHQPFVIVAQRAAAFLTQNAVAGKGRAQPRQDEGFRAPVIVGHQIDGALVVHLERRAIALTQQRAGLAGQAFGHAQVIGHAGFSHFAVKRIAGG